MTLSIASYYEEYKELGLHVIGIEWDVEKKQPISHRKWSKYEDLKLLPAHNAMMIETSGDYGCLDFDHKNASRQTIFQEWKAIVLNQRPEIWDKLYIERTRNAGYHVWLNYKGLKKKTAIADSERGSEVIALYAKGPLVYTYPTPGYAEESGSMQDIIELTKDDFEYLVNTAQGFNEYKPKYDPSLKAINYPKGYESVLTIFDTKISDEAWTTILSEIGLIPLPTYQYNKKDKFAAFKRIGSASDAISAKVYYHNKRVLIFSASLHDYPNWHNKSDYPVWSLPPSFVLFYRNNRSWPAAIEQVTGIMESIGMEIPIIATRTIITDFPLHVFPKHISESILDVSEARSLSPQFVATAGLWTVSSLAGTRYESDFNGEGKNILFCLMIAPVSVGKTPAFKVMCETPLKIEQELLDKKYASQIEEWNKARAKALLDKKPFTMKRPTRYIPIAVDGTTEGYIHKSMSQPNGIGVYQDEAETILNAGNFKSTNDSISFFTQAFSGGRVAQIRADETKERVVPNLNLNLLMGTQPSRLKNIFTEDRLSSGFASRFIMVESDYNILNTESDPFGVKKEMCAEWVTIVTTLFHKGMEFNSGNVATIKIIMCESAKELYRSYNKRLLEEANTRIKTKSEAYIIGTEAKMSAYFPRLTQVLAIIHNVDNPQITEDIVNNAWTLYRYYAESTIKIIASLNGEIENGIPADLELLYEALPFDFTRKEATEACTRLNLNTRRFDVSIRRKDFAQLFTKLGQGKYRKN